MIDLRCHILDGAPCGPDSFAESLEMCRAAVGEGVTTIVATPHWEAGRPEPPLAFEECHRKLERLEARMLGALSLRLGFVLQFSPALPDQVERHGSKLALAGTRHVLVSLPSVAIPAEVDEVWSALARAGFSVVLAHPECNTLLRRDTSKLARWVSDGLTLQIDAASLVGAYGREVRRFAMECARRYRAATVLASNFSRATFEGPRLSSACHALEVELGAECVSDLVSRNPSALLGGPPVGRRRSGVLRQIPGSFATLLRSVGYKAT